MSTHTIGLCPDCGARRVPGASACWQCGGTFATPPTAPVSSLRWAKLPWAGVIPFGLFFLPWVIAGPYWAHRVISVAGLELALGQTLKGHPVPQEPLLWFIPAASLLLGALLFQAHRRTPESWHWLLVTITAWAGFLLLLFKAVQWLWASPAPGTGWVVHWLTTEYLVSGSAFLVSALSATRAWMGSRSPRPQPSSSPSQDAPMDEGEIR
ncbi:hypothetical protein [Candidatus Methylomirabilis sp.]|uniref:hypothetical protein n=1 Tax=Candidatus Methylomirabilis sp. TaxID=2032687 RepID=UPI002A5E5AEB|nr:hypothetical protein [Candidatus Methylomirabilis sp.]